MTKCHFCKSTENLYTCENIQPDHTEKDIYICNACLEKLKAAKKNNNKKRLPGTHI